MELDEEQRAVVESKESLAVIAGPGSGKTRVLTSKAEALMEQGKDIICICFTKAAAKEMSDRVPGLPATTIHSYCCGCVGWDEDWGYTGLLSRFLWESDKRVFDWVLLDEAQDLNEMELDVVLSIVGDKIFAVGDPFQSIYGFQGAMGYGVVEVLQKLGARSVELHNNYRSSPEIVDRLEKIYKRNLVSKNIKSTGWTYILCRTNDDVFYLSNFLKRVNIPHRLRVSVDNADKGRRESDILGESHLRVSTVHCAKGTECSYSILYGWHPQEGGEEKRVYYVAVSRASKTFDETDQLEDIVRLVEKYGRAD